MWDKFTQKSDLGFWIPCLWCWCVGDLDLNLNLDIIVWGVFCPPRTLTRFSTQIWHTFEIVYLLRISPYGETLNYIICVSFIWKSINLCKKNIPAITLLNIHFNIKCTTMTTPNSPVQLWEPPELADLFLANEPWPVWSRQHSSCLPWSDPENSSDRFWPILVWQHNELSNSSHWHLIDETDMKNKCLSH